MVDYNGSSHLVKKIEELLATKKLSTAAAVRMLLEKELYDIKTRYDMQQDIELLKRTSIGLRIYTNPKLALFFLFVLYTFGISDIREPVIGWIVNNLKLIFSLM